MSLSQYNVLERLEKGAIATVFKVRRTSDNEIYSMKKIKLSPLSEREKENALNEVRVLICLSHPNILAYKDAFFDTATTFYIITEFAKDGHLLSKLDTHKKMQTKFSEDEIWSCLVQICRGLLFLHDKKIMHMNIKPTNIFMSEGVIKIGDLNIFELTKHRLNVTQNITLYSVSPEVIKNEFNNPKSDVWLVGWLIYEMTELRPPFMISDILGTVNRVTEASYPKFSPGYSPKLFKVILMMLKVNPVHRPTCIQILDLDIVKSHTFDRNNEISNKDPLKPIEILPSLNEARGAPTADYNIRRDRCNSIGGKSVTPRKGSIFIPSPKFNVQKHDREQERRFLRNIDLSPRYYRNERNNVQRYDVNEILLDDKFQINNKKNYNQDKGRASRPLLQAGVNAVKGELGMCLNIKRLL